MKGQIFSIQKYALHDGPGIRTTVFLKGCPLRCQWCHNPESFSLDQEKIFYESKCIDCGSCDEFTLPEACPSEALQYVRRSIEPEALFEELMKDHVFYEQSKGGVTFSGGEPLIQSDFLVEILKLCKTAGLHTTVDTCGFIAWEHFEKVMPYVDLFLYDVKHYDSEIHKTLTGVGNELIVENLKRLIEKKDVYLRLPIIKGINDNTDYLEKVIALIEDGCIKQLNLLPYHNYAESKYEHLMNDYTFTSFARPSDEVLESMRVYLEDCGFKACIGG